MFSFTNLYISSTFSRAPKVPYNKYPSGNLTLTVPLG
jgi:hypothetical protein